MHTLLNTLQDHDYGHLRIIAENWGFDLPTESALAAAKWLSAAMLEQENLIEITESLPDMAQKALEDILRQGGQVLYPDIIRQFGSIREMGPGRRDRIKPWRNPVSPLEILWYRGLVARTIADTASGPREFLFIPSDLAQQLPVPNPKLDEILGEEAQTPKYIQCGLTTAVVDATTILAWLRKKPMKSKDLDPNQFAGVVPFLHQPQSLELILNLLDALDLLTSQPIQPEPEATRQFLENSKEKASLLLLLTWRDSVKWNDLKHMGGIQFKGDKWPNDPLTSRSAVLNCLRLIPKGKWWDMDGYIQAIHQVYPSYLRPAGDFDSWYLQDTKTGMFLRGFEHWERIDGALLRHILTGPLHLFGASDLGSLGPKKSIRSFRLTSISKALFDPDFEYTSREETSLISVFNDGTISAPGSCPQSHRYQIARFCEWLELKPSGHRYRLSPSSLKRAEEQGLSLNQVKSILERASENSLPPSLLEALSRWKAKGKEAFVEKTIVLRLKDPHVVDMLQTHPTTARLLRDQLGPTVIVIQEKDLEKLYSAAARLGILIDPL